MAREHRERTEEGTRENREGAYEKAYGRFERNTLICYFCVFKSCTFYFLKYRYYYCQWPPTKGHVSPQFFFFGGGGIKKKMRIFVSKCFLASPLKDKCRLKDFWFKRKKRIFVRKCISHDVSHIFFGIEKKERIFITHMFSCV